MITSLDALKAAASLKVKDIEVAGLPFRIREMSLADRDAFVARAKAGENTGPLLFASCVIDEAGAQVFKGQEAAIASEVVPAVIEGVAVEALILSGLTSKND